MNSTSPGPLVSMAGYEVFPNAPVEEAIITIHLSLAGVLAASVERLASVLGDRYPVVEGLDQDVDTEMDAGSPPWTERRIQILSADRQCVIRLSPQAFSYHMLRPYSRWDDFAARAREAFETLVDSPRAHVIDVHLRYVNSFEIPARDGNWEDDLAIFPALPASLDTGLDSFWMTLNLADPSVPATATVTQATRPPANGSVPCILDIDTRSEPFDGYAMTVEQVWRVLEKLREYKNRLFFEGLTERVKELFR